jgi:hypothetical protein
MFELRYDYKPTRYFGYRVARVANCFLTIHCGGSGLMLQAYRRQDQRPHPPERHSGAGARFGCLTPNTVSQGYTTVV